MTLTDRTPEGTLDVLDRSRRGFAELLRADAVRTTPSSALTRGLAGGRGRDAGLARALIVNLLGKPVAVEEGLAALPLVPHILDQLAGGDH